MYRMDSTDNDKEKDKALAEATNTKRPSPTTVLHHFSPSSAPREILQSSTSIASRAVAPPTMRPLPHSEHDRGCASYIYIFLHIFTSIAVILTIWLYMVGLFRDGKKMNACAHIYTGGLEALPPPAVLTKSKSAGERPSSGLAAALEAHDVLGLPRIQRSLTMNSAHTVQGRQKTPPPGFQRDHGPGTARRRCLHCSNLFLPQFSGMGRSSSFDSLDCK